MIEYSCLASVVIDRLNVMGFRSIEHVANTRRDVGSNCSRLKSGLKAMTSGSETNGDSLKALDFDQYPRASRRSSRRLEATTI